MFQSLERRKYCTSSNQHCPFKQTSMTVVALGTSQPQCVSPQGPIQGVSVSSQRKGEVDSIKKTCSISVRVCVCETESNTDLLPPFASIAFRSVPSVRDSCSKTSREGLQHHPACKTEKEEYV